MVANIYATFELRKFIGHFFSEVYYWVFMQTFFGCRACRSGGVGQGLLQGKGKLNVPLDCFKLPSLNE